MRRIVFLLVALITLIPTASAGLPAFNGKVFITTCPEGQGGEDDLCVCSTAVLEYIVAEFRPFDWPWTCFVVPR